MKPLLALLLVASSFVTAFAVPSGAARRRPPNRAAAIEQAKGRKKRSNVKVKRVYERRMVHGRWVRVSRIVRVSSGPAVQPHPEPERYRQIQQALADRGYFKGAVTGVWNADSVDAMRRFQTDKRLTADGKINALSLIGLGLGPKHDGSVASNTVPLPTPPQSEPPK